jgi:transposase InsO family protein
MKSSTSTLPRRTWRTVGILPPPSAESSMSAESRGREDARVAIGDGRLEGGLRAVARWLGAQAEEEPIDGAFFCAHCGAVNRQFPDGVQGHGLNLMADNGCLPTALAFMRACAAMGIRQAFTGYSNPKGNADTERFLRALKEELVWLREWTSPAVVLAALDRWIADDKAGYLHSALGYRSPEAFQADHLSQPLP